jgi:hypothetical protein
MKVEAPAEVDVWGKNTSADSMLRAAFFNDGTTPKAANSKQSKDSVTGLGVTEIESPALTGAVTVLENTPPGCG